VREGKNTYRVLMKRHGAERLPGSPRLMLDNNIEVDLIKEDGKT
jgi:hypothetical protein